jgi:hypothetical protein
LDCFSGVGGDRFVVEGVLVMERLDLLRRWAGAIYGCAFCRGAARVFDALAVACDGPLADGLPVAGFSVVAASLCRSPGVVGGGETGDGVVSTVGT